MKGNTLTMVTMLKAPGGTTVTALCAATGWLPHTARAAISMLQSGHGIAVDRAKPSKDEEMVYSIKA